MRIPRARITAMRALCVAAVATAASLISAPASAYQEPNTIPDAACTSCHPMLWDEETSSWVVKDHPSGGVCVDCHAGDIAGGVGSGYDAWNFSGPHGGYTASTHKCAVCHTVHGAPAGSVLLLPAATIVATCQTCHDGTGGWGVYQSISERGLVPEGGHEIEVTNIIPGGDPTTGSESTASFSGAGSTLICTDCHSPHGADVVSAFLGERRRLRQGTPAPVSTRLLRRTPTGATTVASEYGSDWCLTCHAGRVSGGTLHNHPVESAVTWPDAATRFIYRRLAIIDGAGPTNATVLGALGGTAKTPIDNPELHHSTGFVNTEGNRGYLMPYPRTTSGTAPQDGHYPICQQCHEDTRDVGDLNASGAAAAVAFNSAYGDGVVWDSASSSWVDSTTVNPRFQNFPHETENRRMLVEADDDLCANCHPMAQLP